MKQIIGCLGIVALCLQSCGNDPKTSQNTENTEPQPQEQVMDITVKQEKDSMGTLVLEYEYDKTTGVKHGFYKKYHGNGKLYRELTYQKDKMEGSEKIYYESGKLNAKFSIANGMYDGSFVEYYEDGVVKQEGNYIKDQYQGELKTYYPNGNIKEVVTMLDNLEQGPFEEYNENGSLKAKGTYMSKGEEITALETGLLEEYDKDGKLIAKKICKEGHCCEVWTAKKGDVKPSSKMCEAIVSEQTQ